jgi:putative ABC transport system permease protein
MMPLRPILSTLARHKTAAALIVLEIALTCAIICNAVFLISDRIDRLHLATGLAEDEIVAMRLSSIKRDENAAATTKEDLAKLRALPGVKAVTVVNQVPFGMMAQHSGVSYTPDQVTPTIGVATYFGDETSAGAMGLRIVEGRDLKADEVGDFIAAMRDNAPVPAALVDRATAKRLFPKGDAVGKSVYVFAPHPTRIVGVYETLVPPYPGRDPGGDHGYTMLFGGRVTHSQGSFLIRVDPAQRDAVAKAAFKAVDRFDGNRIADYVYRFDEMRDRFFRGDRAMVELLLGVIVALLVVTAFGIVGLASFWVQQRTRMIGTRRALGATRAQIRHYFQAENLLLTTAGIVLGMIGAYGINQWLMTQYELPRLPAWYLPVGAVVLWALGQVAVLAPARRAAAVPPALAMRGLAA